MSLNWIREELKNREADLETRDDFEKRTGYGKQSLSSAFRRYADHVPSVVAKFGKQRYYLPEELDRFIKWINENSGTRSDVDIKRADIARIRMSIEDTEDRIANHQEALRKAEADRAKFMRDLKRAKSDLEFLEQGS